MKKTTQIAFVSLLILALAGSVVLAAPMQQQSVQNGWQCPYWGQQQSNLTDAQKQDLAAYQQKMVEAKQQMLQKEVEWGWITRAQADNYISQMNQHMVNGPAYGCGLANNGAGMGMMGMRGMGMRCW